MKNGGKTKAQLTDELGSLSQRIKQIETAETSHHITEQKLIDSEIRYRRLFETAQDGILILDGETGYIIDVNPFLTDMLGYPHKEFVGKKLWELGPFKDVEASKTAYQELQNKGYVRYEDLPLETRDGRQIAVEFVSNTYKVNHTRIIQCNIRNITARKHAEGMLNISLQESQQRQAEVSALLKASHAIHDLKGFQNTARAIFDTCKELIGATSGYVALLSKDSTLNEVLFLDAGGLPCTVDESLPMPIRGLRGEAYSSGKAVYNNDFSASEWMKFMPAGHVRLDNVLFAPLIIEGKTVGLLGIANKPGGFTENDALIATSFSKFISIALMNSLILEKLEDQEARFRELFNNMSSGVAIYEAKHNGRDFIFKDINKAVERIERIKKEDIIGKNVLKVFPGVKDFGIFDVFQRVWQTGKPEHFPAAIYQDNRITGWRENYVYKLPTGEIVTVYDDITERTQAEEKSRIIIRTAIDGFWLTDTKGRFLDINDSYCRLTGYSREELLNMSVTEVESAETPSDTGEHIKQLMETGYLRFDTKHRCKDGRIIDIEVSAQYMDIEGGRFFIFLRDITERKKLEQLKDDFINLVSHEMRTPLTVIIGGINTLLSEGDRLSAVESQGLLQDALIEAETLSHILENLLELSRTQAERLFLYPEPISIKKLAQEVVEKFAGQSPHQFVIDFPRGTPSVLADPLRVRRILYNLVQNAVKYSPGSGEIIISARQETGRLVISVKDQGIGIPREDLVKLFSPFQRLAAGQSKKIKGIGLGLLVCRHLVEAHGGHIWVESETNKGSSFYFTLPLKQH